MNRSAAVILVRAMRYILGMLHVYALGEFIWQISYVNFFLGDNILPDDSGWHLEVGGAQWSLPFCNPAVNFATVGFSAGVITALIAASDN